LGTDALKRRFRRRRKKKNPCTLAKGPDPGKDLKAPSENLAKEGDGKGNIFKSRARFLMGGLREKKTTEECPLVEKTGRGEEGTFQRRPTSEPARI